MQPATADNLVRFPSETLVNATASCLRLTHSRLVESIKVHGEGALLAKLTSLLETVNVLVMLGSYVL